MKAQVNKNPWLVNPNRPSVIDLFPTDFFPTTVFNANKRKVNKTRSGLGGNYRNRTKRQLDYDYEDAGDPFYQPVVPTVIKMVFNTRLV